MLGMGECSRSLGIGQVLCKDGGAKNHKYCSWNVTGIMVIVGY
jgi:hypothetical protein